MNELEKLRALLTETILWIEERAGVALQIATAKPLDAEAMARLEAARMFGRARLLRITIEAFHAS